MGSGSWSSRSFADYTVRTKAVSLDSSGSIEYSSYTTEQDIFKVNRIDPVLNPKGVIRECCDSDEHPNTVPVILALDITGSMGPAAIEVSRKLNVIMTDLYKNHKDIEFMIMGIGDLAYDKAPIQASQFESDIRIAEQLDKIYFEHGGGSNPYESYTSAWFIGTKQCKLDCWKRGKKGIIITMGDELPNPYLPKNALMDCTGQTLQSDVETKDLYKEAKEKYDIYHIHVIHGYTSEIRKDACLSEWGDIIGSNNVCDSDINGISQIIVEFIDRSINQQNEGINPETINQDNSTDDNMSILTPINDAIINQDITW